MKKTFKQYLIETPIPDAWDDNIFNERIPFAKRVKYARERATRVGAGSSRIAFVIPYQGRQTVLKVAKNTKGIAQNEAEAEFMSDYYLSGLGITIPLIDYDESNAKPTWIHVEFANKAKDSDFKRVCGGTLNDVMAYSCKVVNKKCYTGGNASLIDDENEFAQSLTELIGNYDIPLGDLSRLANWGVYDGSPVIIDLGLSSDVQKTYYS